MQRNPLSPTRVFAFIIFLSLSFVAAQCSTSAPPATQIDAEANRGDHAHEGLTARLEDLTPVALADGEKLRVVATTNIVADLVGNVAGDAVELISMLPVDTDPHAFSPTPRDITAVADAHLVFVNGLNLEGFLGTLIENAAGEAVVIAVSNDVETREFEAVAGDDQEHSDGIDPHVWMTPTNARVMVHNIEAALSALDPANHETYEANAKAYEAELEALDAWVMEQINTIPEANREMVTDHDSFGYYADRYGLKIVGAVIPAYSTAAEPSAQELAALQEQISKIEAKALFVGTTVNPKLAEQVAQDTGIQVVSLYTGSLGQPKSSVETYLDFIRVNTMAIVEALR